MKTFQIIFQNGRVQNLAAENWKRDTELIRFCTDDGGAVEFPSHDLIMIDELPEDGSSPEEFGEAFPQPKPPSTSPV